jgi:hypothetical protein
VTTIAVPSSAVRARVSRGTLAAVKANGEASTIAKPLWRGMPSVADGLPLARRIATATPIAVNPAVSSAAVAVSQIRRVRAALGYSDGRMLATVKSVADAAVQTLTSNYEQLASIALSSCEQLNRAADYYEDTDAAAAARVDATYQ